MSEKVKELHKDKVCPFCSSSFVADRTNGLRIPIKDLKRYKCVNCGKEFDKYDVGKV